MQMRPIILANNWGTKITTNNPASPKRTVNESLLDRRDEGSGDIWATIGLLRSLLGGGM
jgi:hypothetical protein